MGERFPFFASNRTHRTSLGAGWGYDDVPRFDSTVLLDTNGMLPSLPVSIATTPDAPCPSQAFTPFAPELGYHVTADDFDPVLREWKINRPPYLNAKPMNWALSSLHVAVSALDTRELGLLEQRLTRWGEMDWDFRPDVASVVAGLRLQIFANGLRLESRPDLHALGGGSIRYIHGFYPFDTGPLAVPDPVYWHEGLSIAVPPTDDAALSQVEGRFVLSASRSI